MKPKSTKEKLGGCAGLKPVRCNGLKHHMKHRDVTRLAVYLATYNDSKKIKNSMTEHGIYKFGRRLANLMNIDFR